MRLRFLFALLFSLLIVESSLRAQQQGLNLNDQLLSAANKGDLVKIKDLVAKGANINIQDKKYGQSPLMLAVGKGNIEMVNYLISKGADPNLKEKTYGQTALALAQNSGKTEIAAVLQKAMGVSSTTSAPAGGGGTAGVISTATTPQQLNEALYAAARSNNLGKVKELLEQGADPTAQSRDQMTPSIAAARLGYADVVGVLRQAEADWEKKKQGGGAEAGAQPGTPDEPAAESAGDTLVEAADKGNLEAIKAALEKGAEVDAKSNEGWTALLAAAWAGRVDMLNFLMDKGADIKFKTEKGETALYFAAMNGHVNIVNLLLTKGADINTATVDGMTPLGAAIKEGRALMVKELVAKGADLTVKTTAGHSILQLATDKQHLDIVETIKKAMEAKGQSAEESGSGAVASSEPSATNAPPVVTTPPSSSPPATPQTSVPVEPDKASPFPDPKLPKEEVIAATPGIGTYKAKKGSRADGAFTVFIPTEYNPNKTWPLIVSSHGAGTDGIKEMRGWQNEAKANGWIVVCPSFEIAASGNFGILSKDDAMLKEIMDRVFGSLNIDRNHILGTGFSGGGYTVHYLMMNHPEWFTALCFRSANYVGPGKIAKKNEWKTRPVYMLWGEKDHPLIISGGNSPGGDGPASLKFFTNTIHCEKLKHEVIPGMGHGEKIENVVAWFRDVVSGSN